MHSESGLKENTILEVIEGVTEAENGENEGGGEGNINSVYS